jgi:hypothetical protein
MQIYVDFDDVDNSTSSSGSDNNLLFGRSYLSVSICFSDLAGTILGVHYLFYSIIYCPACLPLYYFSNPSWYATIRVNVISLIDSVDPDEILRLIYRIHPLEYLHI